MTTHTLSVLVENKPGVLAHVAALFSRRAFNITSLSVGPTSDDRVSSMTIVVDGETTPVDQVHKQLEKLVRVLKVVELAEDEAVERDLALIKVTVRPQLRANLLDVAASLRATVVDLDPETIVREAVCSPGRLYALLGELEPLGTCEVVRTGLIAIGRGSGTITDDQPALAVCA
jgi:acetolactate synthase-1/3 small subunit